MVRFSPSHHWFYFPDMETNEVLLIKGFDSKEDGRARFTAHAGIRGSDSPGLCPGERESIEARALVFRIPETTPESDRRGLAPPPCDRSTPVFRNVATHSLARPLAGD
jgi:hypothetical protein